MAYNSLAAFDMFERLLREALWAPLLIVLASLALGRVLAAQDLWWLMHVLGGAAVAFCYLRATRIAGALLGDLRIGTRYVLAFTAACSTALAWEMLEFTSDQFFGTDLQEGEMDTMSDLLLSVAGAAAYLAWHALIASGHRGAAPG
jgi:hypothetical protein